MIKEKYQVFLRLKVAGLWLKVWSAPNTMESLLRAACFSSWPRHTRKLEYNARLIQPIYHLPSASCKGSQVKERSTELEERQVLFWIPSNGNDGNHDTETILCELKQFGGIFVHLLRSKAYVWMLASVQGNGVSIHGYSLSNRHFDSIIL